MRKVSYTMMVSLDGFIEGPDPDLDWVLIDEELHRFANDQARAAELFLYGRRMYEVMAAYWPTADAKPEAPYFEVEYAKIWQAKPKVVFSRTLGAVAHNSRLAREGLAEEVAELKAGEGGEIEVSGAEIAAALIGLGLVDEYGLIVQPVLLGGGKRYFPPLESVRNLRLLETRRFGSGVAYLRYEAPSSSR